MGKNNHLPFDRVVNVTMYLLAGEFEFTTDTLSQTETDRQIDREGELRIERSTGDQAAV